ncbi:NADP-dependent oxidoreductase [Nocardia sp. NBC_00565]|uniref:NADP-dependent oxidoreductase n=1 Tax=Nocardia sp. NBC_00565 TaxID=2975993 RepID=UPI002E81E3D7|nr:NADP-dependent oxidoreductase [Nocardia sp. NBC_00565]WUC05347.1 NADP-dependent oxidoreductase [Nocardia sp. NBC_00565]
MLAITQQTFGGPEVLEIVEVDRPSAGPGEVVVRVAATGMNAADWKLRSGLVRKLGDPPFTLGFDVSGIVDEVGAGVERFQLGDEVYGMVLSRSGGYAEYVVAQADILAPKPAIIDHIHAAALPTAVLTAWQGLAGVVAGQRVLVHAAAGGVGHFAVQLAKDRGAYVIGTARAAKHEFLRELGADEVIDYTTTDFADAVRDIDLVFDLVGGAYGSRSLPVLRAGGRLIDAQGNDAEDDPRYERLYVSPSGNDLRDIADLLEHGRLRVEIDQVLPMAEVVKAHQLSESGRVRGKIVLVPWNSPA